MRMSSGCKQTQLTLRGDNSELTSSIEMLVRSMYFVFVTSEVLIDTQWLLEMKVELSVVRWFGRPVWCE